MVLNNFITFFKTGISNINFSVTKGHLIVMMLNRENIYNDIKSVQKKMKIMLVINLLMVWLKVFYFRVILKSKKKLLNKMLF